MMDPKIPIARALTRRVSILVVDDEPMTLAAMQRNLSDAAHEVYTAASASQAQVLLRQRRFDAIVLDVHLNSDPDGLIFLDMLKKDPATSRIPVLMITGDAREDVLPRARAKGASDCLQKPLSFDVLKLTLDHFAEEVRRDCGAAQSPPGEALVLHVEDDDEWADLVRGWLAGTGLTLQRVAGRRELLRFLEGRPGIPDCILLDLGLADADGLKVCDELQAHPRWQRIPILILTSREDQRLAGLKHKALNFVAKQSEGAGEELIAALGAIISHDKRSADVLELGDIRLDPRGPRVYRDGKLICSPDEGAFAVLRLLVERSPNPVSDAGIRAASMRRRDYRRRAPVDPRPHTVEVYVSRIRRLLGDEVGSRIARVHQQGYVYLQSAKSNQP